jgi:hypothetical protein
MLQNIVNNAIGCEGCTITCDSPIKKFTNPKYKIILTIFAAGKFSVNFFNENDGRNEANPPQSFMADGTLRRYDRADGFG